MNNICVFCGSSSGKLPIFQKTASDFGKILARKKITLIYGGGQLGLMGILANAVLENGGRVIGVIPEFMMDKEVAHTGLTDLHVTTSMHTRKYKMAELADAFAVLPGGLGTLDELAEILTWNQLQLIRKPIGLLNVNNYYDQLLSLMDNMVDHGFLRRAGRELLINEKDPLKLLEMMRDSERGKATYRADLKQG